MPKNEHVGMSMLMLYFSTIRVQGFHETFLGLLRSHTLASFIIANRKLQS